MDCIYNPSNLESSPEFLPILEYLNEERLAYTVQNTSDTVTFQSSNDTQTIVHPYIFNWTGPTNDTIYSTAAQALANIFNGMIGSFTTRSRGNSGLVTYLISKRTRFMETSLISVVNTTQHKAYNPGDFDPSLLSQIPS
jgi:hypothetical protein